MGIKKTPVIFWIYVGIMVIAVCLSGCDCDKPTEPKPEELKDYSVYFCAPGYSPELFIFHPTTRVIDSIEIPWEPTEGVTVSADGERLYLAQRSSVVVVDTDSFSLITELPFVPRLWPAVSPNNEYLAIPGDDLNILRTSDYSVLFSDTDITEFGKFSSDSRDFYCAAGWSSVSSGLVYKVDLSDGSFPVERHPFDDGGVVHVVPSIDDTKWFLYLRLPSMWTWAFEVYDVALDSVTFRDVLVPGVGDVAITPDGHTAFYTNPGRSSTDPIAPPGFTIFDVDANMIDTVVEDIEFFTGSTWMASPNQIVVTPDGRWLVILGGSLGLGVLYLYDIEKRELVFREDFGGASGHAFTNLSVQLQK